MLEKNSITKSIFKGAWRGLTFIRNLFLNLLFFVLGIALILSLTAEKDVNLEVPDNAALVLNLSGQLVIQKQYIDPMGILAGGLTGGSTETEILVKELVSVIDKAKEDPRISSIVLDLQYFTGGGLDKLQTVSKSLTSFKESGKPIYAMGDYYDRNQYYLASHADHLYLNPMGGVMIDGYARYGMYHKDALDMINASTHVFRVGTYKSAVEPYLRNDMSPAAKEANQMWLDELWQQYKNDIAQARNFPINTFDDTFDSFLGKLANQKGDVARYALEYNWVDDLITRESFSDKLKQLVGEDKKGKSYNKVTYADYRKTVLPSPLTTPSQSDQIAVVVAKGTILPGNQQAGTIGGDSTADLLKQARLDDSIKAVVLQVDSGGGSAFASEIIRQQVLELKKAGKPVVASMSSVAASGGYWISTSADIIVAHPSTITGSIGIFGRLVTFEDTLAKFGVYTDGIAATEFGGFSITRGLPQGYKDYLQLSVEHGYDQFISLVATTRDQPKQNIDNIAQGRVWTGTQALKHGLVDELGGLELAIQRASELADVSDYAVKYIELERSPRDILLDKLLSASGPILPVTTKRTTDPKINDITDMIKVHLGQTLSLHDPDNLFYLCTDCQIQ